MLDPGNYQPKTVLNSCNLQHVPRLAYDPAAGGFIDGMQQKPNFLYQYDGFGQEQQNVMQFAAVQRPPPLPGNGQDYTSPALPMGTLRPPTTQMQHEHGGQNLDMPFQTYRGTVENMPGGTGLTPNHTVEGFTGNAHQAQNWAFDLANGILHSMARQIVPNLDAELRKRFGQRSLSELHQSFLRTLESCMQQDRGPHSTDGRSSTLPLLASNNNNLGGTANIDDQHGARPMSAEGGEEHMTAAATGGFYPYEGMYLEELKRDAENKRKAPCRCQPHDCDKVRYLTCLKANCVASFSTKLSWDRHIRQTIANKTWLCPICFDDKKETKIFNRSDRYMQHVHGHFGPDPTPEQRYAVQKACQYLPYTPPFWDFCRVCSERFNDLSKWLDHVHDHFKCATDAHRPKLKKKWTESYPPPIPNDFCGPSLNLCHAVDACADNHQGAETLAKQGTTPRRTSSKQSGGQKRLVTTRPRKQSKSYQCSLRSQREDNDGDLQTQGANSSLGKTSAGGRPRGVSNSSLTAAVVGDHVSNAGAWMDEGS